MKCIDGDKASGVIVGWDENIEDLTEKNNALSSEIQKTVREKEKSKVKLHAISNGHYLNNRLLFDVFRSAWHNINMQTQPWALISTVISKKENNVVWDLVD